MEIPFHHSVHSERGFRFTQQKFPRPFIYARLPIAYEDEGVPCTVPSELRNSVRPSFLQIMLPDEATITSTNTTYDCCIL
jgi:hypothetical protein